jgi:hypothetical protein
VDASSSLLVVTIGVAFVLTTLVLIVSSALAVLTLTATNPDKTANAIVGVFNIFMVTFSKPETCHHSLRIVREENTHFNAQSIANRIPHHLHFALTSEAFSTNNSVF